MQSAEGQVSATYLRALATVIVGDRVIGMFLVRNLLPTTRAVAELNRDMQAWVRGTIAANDGEATGARAHEPASSDSAESYPEFGAQVYAEKMPEAIRKVPPEYPEAARLAGISGTVMVGALIGRDGRVKDTRIIESIPALDRAAAAAVRQWTFKPAHVKRRPVPMWVRILVKFTLH